MENTVAQVSFTPIGKVIMQGESFLIQLEAAYAQGLAGVEDFSHIQVVWWGNQYDSPETRQILTAESPYKGGPEQIGIFATRSPIRPNPILMTVAQVISVDARKGIIEVPFIDAEPDTPVLDIKPYHPSSDRVKEVKVPGYAEKWPKWLEDSASFDWSAVFNF